jgi:hypothetical protein
MKKLAILFMTILFAFSVLHGQPQNSEQTPVKEPKAKMVPLKKLEGTNVSEVAKRNFIGDFGNLPNVKWVRSVTFDEATFSKDGKERIAFYDFDGKLVGTTEPVAFSVIPAKGQQEIKAKYQDYKPGTVIFYDDNTTNDTDMFLYGLQFEDKDNYFVELTNGTKKIVVRVDNNGAVSFFKNL